MGDMPDWRGEEPWYDSSFVDCWTRFWRKYAAFTGRASRSEFWFAFVGNAVIVIFLYLVVGSTSNGPGQVAALTLFVFQIGVVLPTLAIIARRLHDANMSGWLILVGLVPFLGWIILLGMACMPSDARGRRFDRVPPDLTYNGP